VTKEKGEKNERKLFGVDNWAILLVTKTQGERK
jgi:hypothetical protein